MATITELSSLASALGVEKGELISLVGGGGKTTSLFTLGSQLQGTTVLTTTTKMGAEQSSTYPLLVDPSDGSLRSALTMDPGRVLAWKDVDGRRAVGVSAETCDRWFDIADNVVTEADGSRKRPFKAPTHYEPVVPSKTTLLVGCIGISAFGHAISERCHRPELVAGLADCSIDDLLTPARAAAVLVHPDGSQKNRPAQARFTVALHRVGPDDDALIDELAEHLGEVALVAVREAEAL